MLRIHCLVLTALLATSSLVHGQAGVERNEFSQGSRKKAAVQAHERLADRLNKQGHAVQQSKTKNGAVVLAAKLQKGDCKYPVEIECTPGKKTCKLTCPVGNPARFSRAQLLKLLTASGKCSRGRFVCRASDNMLCFEDPTCSDSDGDFQQDLDNFLDALSETQPLWSGDDDQDGP